MKINLKNKIMLTVLAGGMLCANSVFATNWYGTEYNKWTTVQGDAGTTGLRLTINNSTKDVGGNGWDGIENIYGSYSTSAHITDNIVSITGGIFTGLSNIESGCAEGDSNTVMNCMLNVSGGTFGNVTNLQVGYSKNGTLKNNILNITGGDLRGVRFIQGVFGDSGDKENNIVNISGGTFPSNVEIKGAYSSNRATVKGNKVYITGGDFTGEAKIYGASTNIYVSTVQDNLVEISGGTFGGNVEIYGACQNNAGPVTGNTVTISGGDFGSGIKLYGGMGSTSSNNTLNLKIKMGSKANEVKFFQNMNFTLPSNITNGDVMLETASVTYDNTTIGVDAANGVKLNSGDVITLIAADDKNGDVSNINETVLGGAGVISMDGNNLILTLLKDFGVGGDRGKAPVEGIAAATAMINQSADLALGEGLASLLANTLQTEEKETEPANENNSNIATSPVVNTFGAVTANRSKYKTGSHVDMDGWGFLVGAGTSKNWTSGDKTTYGLFFEYGKGDFDTYNNDIHGEGDSNNKGVGVIARHTLKNNTYIDGAVRYGKQETEWSESEIGGYDTDSRYYGVALGLGHIYPLSKNEIDIYGRYSFGHTGACDAKVKDSDYHFDSVKSHRIRLGAKYNFVQEKSNAKPYVGLAWEHEFNGESKATITGVGEAPAPSLKGNTGIFEIGCDWDTGKWTLGAEANAYIGKRKGWGGMLNAFYNF